MRLYSAALRSLLRPQDPQQVSHFLHQGTKCFVLLFPRYVRALELRREAEEERAKFAAAAKQAADREAQRVKKESSQAPSLAESATAVMVGSKLKGRPGEKTCQSINQSMTFSSISITHRHLARDRIRLRGALLGRAPPLGAGLLHLDRAVGRGRGKGAMGEKQRQRKLDMRERQEKRDCFQCH